MGNNWRKVGGLAALFEAFAYIVGFAAMLTVLSIPEGMAPVEQLRFVLGKAGLYQAWHVVIYVLFGAALVALTAALHERLASGAPLLMKIASPFGMIWAGMVIATGMIANLGLAAAARVIDADPAHATQMWLTLNVVQEGLGGGVELVGGLWLVLASVAALRCSAFPRLLNYLGIVVGLAGILTVVPPLGGLAAVFGLGQIAWFIWLGVTMLGEPWPD